MTKSSLFFVYNYLADMLFFNMILRLILEGYMNYAVSCFLNATDVRS